MTADIGMPVRTSPGGVRVERVVTSGVFELDGGSWEVDNNVWLVGDDTEVLVVDAAHDAGAILAAVDGRRVTAVVCTHGHNDHVNAVGEVVAATGATAALHPDDRVLWDQSQSEPPGADLADGQVFTVGDVELTVLHTPGHAPGCLLPPRPGPGRAVLGGHPVQRRARSHRSVLLRLPHDRRVDPQPAARPAGRHRGADGPRRPDHHRCRGPAPAGVDRPRLLTGPRRIGGWAPPPVPLRG